jgi:hypothetical protein
MHKLEAIQYALPHADTPAGAPPPGGEAWSHAAAGRRSPARLSASPGLWNLGSGAWLAGLCKAQPCTGRSEHCPLNSKRKAQSRDDREMR